MFDDLNEEIVNSFTSELSNHKGSYAPVDYLINEFEGEWHWRSEYIK